MSSYTSADEIAAYLAVTLTPEQEAQAEIAASAITAWIDHRTGRSWQAIPSAVSQELHAVTKCLVWLTLRPVTAVSAVSARLRGSLEAWSDLDAADWLLADADAGRLELAGLTDGHDVRVDYTSALTAVPDDLAYAATVLAGDLMFATLHPEAAGLESLALGQNDISLRYANASGGGRSGAATAALAVVDSYARPVLA